MMLKLYIYGYLNRVPSSRRLERECQRNIVQTMRQMFEWLKENEVVSANPCDGVKVKKPKTPGFLEWTYEEILQYEKKWSIGTRERVMLDVYMYTGLRRGDAAVVGKQHVRNGVISLQTEKTGQWVHIPLLDVLKRTLDAGPTGDLSFNATSSGRPFAKESLGNRFKEACVAAGIMDKAAPDCVSDTRRRQRRHHPRVDGDLWLGRHQGS
jgi:integrase